MTTSVDNAQTATDPTDTLGTVIDDVIRPQAPIVDRDGAFPRPGVDALAAAGLLGLASSTEVGGAGHGMRTVAEVIERLAADSDGGAHALRGDRRRRGARSAQVRPLLDLEGLTA
ncbi:acyl-CoA dehydrogenase family protein [Micromonospora sp. NPDC048986]|uniref:acyl-CoA dehydrogenase family protein n=1 Tax=Micromonospora sp. NPDC048986 TaxID=3155644 RepID=UPI0033F2D85A